ncbi:MAG: hypothetical protein V1755_10735 [Chloroflexota bacterium]
MVTEEFEKVIAEVGKLPADDQRSLARWILEQLQDEKRWQKSFAASQDLLEKMANEALEERAKGGTKPYGPSAR